MRLFLVWYGASFVGFLLLVAAFVLPQGVTVTQLPVVWGEVLQALAPRALFWAFLLIPYGIFAWFRSVVRARRDHGWASFGRALLVRVVVPIVVVAGGIAGLRYYSTHEDFAYEWDSSVENDAGDVRDRYAHDGKQRGVHLFGGDMDSTAIAPLIANNVEWLVHVPFAWMDAYDDPELRMNSLDGFDFTERDRWLAQRVELAKTKGFHNVIKPHIWLRGGDKWRSDISMKTDAAWREWFGRYRQLIVHYAVFAEAYGVEVLCVGTELQGTVRERPDDWLSLIEEVRAVYSGKLVYAANWNDPLEEIPLWDVVDYIGVQAYFPLCNQDSPPQSCMMRGWRPYFESLRALSRDTGKPVLFTELGYKSTADAATHPWEWQGYLSTFVTRMSQETQLNCYNAFFETFWQEDWFAGVYIWKWGVNHERTGGDGSHFFTPQNKPAQNAMARWFARPAAP